MHSIEKEHIKYGPFQNDSWYILDGIDHPIIQKILNRIKAEVNFMNYSAFIYGGILEGWPTRDLDMVILGPWNPITIKKILSTITKISFDEGFQIDVRYQIESKVFDFKQWLNTDLSIQTYNHAILDDKIYLIQEDKIMHEYKYTGVWKDGLFITKLDLPMEKQLNKYKAENFIYKSPYKLL